MEEEQSSTSSSTSNNINVEDTPIVGKSGRFLDDVNESLQIAKIELNEVLPVSQELLYSDNFLESDLLLLELQDDVLESFQLGSKVVLRGDPEDSAVICTESSTYELKETENSNLVLILNEFDFPETANYAHVETNDNTLGNSQRYFKSRPVVQEFGTYLEMTKHKPCLVKIYHLLKPTIYDGNIENSPSFDPNKSHYKKEDLVTLDTLLDKVPGSKKEIENYLQTTLKTIEINGFIRLVDSDYLFQVLSQVLDCIESFSWIKNGIKKSVILSELSSLHPHFMLHKIFHWFFNIETNETTGGSSDSYEMKEFEICRFIGEVILKTGKKFTLSEFKSAWKTSVPRGLRVDLSQLHFIGIVDLESSPPSISYCPEAFLPDTVTERILALFKIKPKWVKEELLAYVECIYGDSVGAGSALAKNTRIYTGDDGIKYCIMRYDIDAYNFT